MHALLTASGTGFEPGAVLAEVPEPVPAPDEVVVEVRHVSLNFGEVRHLGALPEGTALGYDASGHVVRAAADGSGPAPGEPVLAFGAGAWAQRATFPTASVAVVPAALDLAKAAALPMAGITALRTLRAAGPLLGRRVLVTGASGGVGRFAVQLARMGGAHVVASVGSPARGDGLGALGAGEVVVGLDGVEPVDVVLDTVGGTFLPAAWALLRPGGVLQSIGWASGEPAVFPPWSTFAPGAARTIASFGDVTEPGPDLAVLAGMAARGALSVEIGWRGPWTRVGEATAALLGRRVRGKAVLDVGPVPAPAP